MTTAATPHSSVGAITSGLTTSCWSGPNNSTTVPDSYPPLASDATCDVCVIGGGIAGLSVAYHCAVGGLSVILIEDGILGSGESGRTTGYLTTAVDDHYAEITKKWDVATAQLVAKSHVTAIDMVEQIVTTENIDCDFVRLPGYLIESGVDSIVELQREMDATLEAGLQVTMVTCPPSLGTFGRSILFPNQAQFHINKYLAGLAAASVRRGAQIFTRTHASKVTGGSPAEVETSQGHRIVCKHVVEATNTPISNVVTMFLKQKAYRSYVIAAPVRKNVVPLALYFDTSDPYHYARLAPLNEQYDLLMVGGEDHPVGQADDFEIRFTQLEHWMRTHFPETGVITDRWSGQIQEPHDGLAFLGRNPGDKGNVYIITGDSGMGMTHGSLGGYIVADLIRGVNNPFAGIYDPARKPTHSIGSSLSENMNTQKQYLDWIKSGDVKDIEDIQAGCGAVVRKGLHKLAVYRDINGQVHSCSATCPHLGAVVRWNDLEKSWDCPAHGSRFNAYGEAINGPAIRNLEPKSE